MCGLTCQDFSVSYGKKEVVHQVNMAVPQGQLVALLGANGCGKTTLMRGICGLASSQGTCLLGGDSFLTLSNREKSRRLSYIPQRTSLSFSIVVLDMVLMGFHSRLGLFESHQPWQREQAIQALDWMGVAHLAQADFLTLSEGQKQLVILARAMVQDTNFFLFDEPDSAMDFNNKHMVMGKIKDMIQGSRAGLICLHDANFALRYCQRGLLMEQGRIIQDLDLVNASKETLTQGLSRIYGNIELLEDGSSYLMTVGTSK